MSNRSILYSDLWKIWKESPHYRAQIDHWMNLKKNLPVLSWKTQMEVLDNAPEDIIKAHVQLLKPEAKRKLGLEVKAKKKEWGYVGFL